MPECRHELRKWWSSSMSCWLQSRAGSQRAERRCWANEETSEFGATGEEAAAQRTLQKSVQGFLGPSQAEGQAIQELPGVMPWAESRTEYWRSRSARRCWGSALPRGRDLVDITPIQLKNQKVYSLAIKNIPQTMVYFTSELTELKPSLPKICREARIWKLGPSKLVALEKHLRLL